MKKHRRFNFNSKAQFDDLFKNSDIDFVEIGLENNKYVVDTICELSELSELKDYEIEVVGGHYFSGIKIPTKQEKVFNFIDLLKEAVARLEYGAKRKAIGKDGTQEYIETQERIYFRKYQIATNVIPDFGGLIEKEATDFGFSLEDYKALIIQKYEAGKALFDMLTAMIEYARSKALLFVETDNLPKAKQVLQYMNDVEVSNTIEELTEILETIKNL